MSGIRNMLSSIGRRGIQAILVALPGLALCSSLMAQGSDRQTNGATGAEPKASRAANVVRRSLDFYQGLQGFSMDCDLDLRIQKGNFSGGMSDGYSVAMERPNRLAVSLRARSNDVALVCDGSRVFTYIAGLNAYEVAPAPASAAEIKGPDIHKFTEHLDPLGYLDLFLDRGPSNVLARAGASAESAGAEKIDGVPCSRIRFSSPEWVSEIWVEEGSRPLIHKFAYNISVADLKSIKTDPEMAGSTIQVVVHYGNWKLNPAFADDAFKFAPPPSAEPTASLHYYALEKASAPLLGKPAPDFRLDLMDGSQLDLAGHKGKHTVILEFWAVWSVPSTRGLQEITRLADSYKSRDVAFYAIEAGDAPEVVNAALSRLKVNPAVGIERTNEISALYNVSAPQFVIIDKEGVVRFCWDDYQHPFDLKRRLDEVLANEPHRVTKTAYGLRNENPTASRN